MSLAAPTTKEINDTIIAQMEASLGQSIPILPKAFLRVLARTLAGVFVLLYKYAGFMFLQMFVQSATISNTVINGKTVSPLIEWGRLIGVGDPAPATNAEMIITVTVETQGGTLSSGAQLVNSDTGVVYITVGSVALNAATVQATIRAASDQAGGNGAGVIGNLDAGAAVSFANPLPNVSRAVVVTSQTVTGADGESVAAYRQRILDRFQKRPQGGAYADYEAWGEEPAGILNIYPYTGTLPGTVEVYVEAAGTVDGIPTGAQLIEVYNSINLDSAGLATRRPVGARVEVFPISRPGLDVVVTNMSGPDQAALQVAIEAGLSEYFLAAEPFIGGLSALPRRDVISAASAAGVISGIVSAGGGVFESVRITLGVAQVGIYTLGVGEKAKLASVTFE